MNEPTYPNSSIRLAKGRSFPTTAAWGFTLVELLAALAVLAVLVTVGAPSMAVLVHSIRLTSASNGFLSHLHLARSEAIKRSARVVLCKSPDGLYCIAGGGWEQGWIVFHDANGNGWRESTETIIQREQALGGDVRLMGNLNVARYVSFSPNGTTRLVGGGFQAGTLTVCHQSMAGGEARQIILNAVGRPRVHKTEVGSCA